MNFNTLKTIKNIRLHILIWSIFFLTDYLFGFAIQAGENFPLPSYISNALFCVTFFYVCVYKAILPNIEESFLKTFFIIILLIAIFCGLKFGYESIFKTVFFSKRILEEKKYFAYFCYEAWRLSTITFYAFAYWYYLKSVKEERLRRLTEEKLLKTEIAFLKAQINPHFLFNTLNFIYNDVSRLSAKSGEAMMSLTRLMRYSVESTKNEHTTVGQEIEHIQEYIKLQRVRFGDRLSIKYSTNGGVLFFSFPPLILLSIVENAFKFGIHDDPNDPIELDLKVNFEGLTFRCKNKKRKNFSDKETTGIGLANIEKRLEMSFQNNFTMETINSENHFELLLKVTWKV